MFSLFSNKSKQAKNILILNANPKKESFCKSISEACFSQLESQSVHQVKIIHLFNMQFDSDLPFGYEKNDQDIYDQDANNKTQLEEDLINFQKELSLVDHIIFVSPVWWGSLPAKFKGLIDRTFLPGFAFKYSKENTFPKKLLKGKTASLFFTLDTPTWYYKLFQKAPAIAQLKITILDFCGIKTTKIQCVGPIIKSDIKQREKYLRQCVNSLNSI